MNQRAKKMILGSGVATAGITVAGITSYAVTKYILKIAIDRDAPKMLQRGKVGVRGSKSDSAFYDAVIEGADKLKNSNCDEVEITSHDGLKLIGHWHPCENAKRVIIAMHGWRSSWTNDFGMIADFWFDNDCSVLFAEQRGQNNSGGDYMGFGMLERYDCLNWIKWVNEHGGENLPIYLGGVSMGASTVLMTAGLELPENVRGIIADCGFTSPHDIWKHVAENNLHLPYGLYQSAANDLCKKKIKVGSKDYSAVQAMKECKIPVLFIHGTDDNFVPIEMTYENYKACAAPKRLLVVPGADHGMSYYIAKDEYESNVKKLWQDYD